MGKRYYTIGEQIRYCRRKKYITQVELARMVGMHYSSVSKWETEEAYPRLETIIRLCKIFEINVSTIFGEDDREDLDF